MDEVPNPDDNEKSDKEEDRDLWAERYIGLLMFLYFLLVGSGVVLLIKISGF